MEGEAYSRQVGSLAYQGILELLLARWRDTLALLSEFSVIDAGLEYCTLLDQGFIGSKELDKSGWRC